MVFHSHMLNPRGFLEDCMRFQASNMWTAGMPWQQVNNLIDLEFNYNATEPTKVMWNVQMRRAWENAEDSMVKRISCPCCKQSVDIPWTTCSLPEDSKEAP